MSLDFLGNVTIFSDLDDNQISEIKEYFSERKYPKNSMIILEEEFGDIEFIIRSGTVKITRVNDEGKEVILSLLGPGEIFGEMAIIDGESRSANALAQENCILLAFPQNEFIKILRTYFDVSFALMGELDHRLRKCDQQIEALSLSDAENRIGVSMLNLAEDMGITDDTQVVVYDDTFGALASRVAWTLQYVGHSNVALLEVTYSQWKELGLKTSIEKPNIKPVKHSLNLKPDIMATAEYLEKAKEKKNVVLIDNRERLNFLEQHIPGSINIPYRTLSTDGKILRTKESMRNFLKNRGIPEDAEIITYCALKSIGIPNVKLYVHSFKEWKSLEKPIGKQENASYWDLSAE